MKVLLICKGHPDFASCKHFSPRSISKPHYLRAPCVKCQDNVGSTLVQCQRRLLKIETTLVRCPGDSQKTTRILLVQQDSLQLTFFLLSLTGPYVTEVSYISQLKYINHVYTQQTQNICTFQRYFESVSGGAN